MAKRPSKKILEALADLAKALRRIDAPSMVIGGIAVIAHGVARQTIDIDATVLAARLDISKFLETLAEGSIRPRIPNFLEFAEKSQVLLLVHEKTKVTLEISFAYSSFEQEALAQAVEVKFGGIKISVATPEDLVIYKVLAWRDRDRYDIEHLLLRVEDSERLARFMGYFNSKLAREVARSTGWRDKVFSRRYQAILVSDEEEAQVGRLVYILSHGCKENLVARPQDWPGVHCVTGLLSGEPIEGTWFNRTKEWEERQRGEEFGALQFAETEVVTLSPSPLPCWRHLAGEPYRERIAELVEAIIAQAAARRAKTGIEPLGPVAIFRQQPFSQPAKTKRSPAPLVHAATKKVRTEMKIAYAWFARVFREAAEYLRAGDRLARFPRGSFPPGLPFVRACRLAISPAT